MSLAWQDDNELFQIMEHELFTAVVADCLDQVGLLHQCLPPQIKALDRDMVVVGRAMTVLEADIFSSELSSSRNPLLNKPFGLMLEALDDLKPGEVYFCTGGRVPYAMWGELMSTRALRLGARGAVLDGYTRDTKGILSLKFPTFAYGAYAQDQSPRGKVIDFRVEVEVGSVRVRPGDLVFGDYDGVLIIPREAEEEVLSRAIEKARGENLVREKISEGMSATEAFEKYGIL